MWSRRTLCAPVSATRVPNNHVLPLLQPPHNTEHDMEKYTEVGDTDEEGGLVVVVEKDLVCTSECNKGPTATMSSPYPTTTQPWT